jgi:hypothetical protein
VRVISVTGSTRRDGSVAAFTKIVISSEEVASVLFTHSD